MMMGSAADTGSILLMQQLGAVANSTAAGVLCPVSKPEALLVLLHARIGN